MKGMFLTVFQPQRRHEKRRPRLEEVGIKAIRTAAFAFVLNKETTGLSVFQHQRNEKARLFPLVCVQF